MEIQNEHRDPERAMWRLLYDHPELVVSLPDNLKGRVIFKEGAQVIAFCANCKHQLSVDLSADSILKNLDLFVRTHTPDCKGT